MEILGLVDIPIWSLLLLTSLVLLYIYGAYPMGMWAQLGVPGPKPWAFIGNAHVLYGSKDGFSNTIRKMISEHGKICGAYFFRQPILYVTDLEALKEVFVKDFKNFTDRPLTGGESFFPHSVKDGVLFSKGMDWKRKRSILSPNFTILKLKSITPNVNITSRQLRDKLKQHATEGTRAKAKTVFGAFALDVLASTAFGLDLDSQNSLHGSFFQSVEELLLVKALTKIAIGLNSLFPFLGFILRKLNLSIFNEKSIKYFETEVNKLIMERKANSECGVMTDLLQLMLNSEMDPSADKFDEKKMTTAEIVSQCVVLIIGGYETTSTSMEFISYHLAKYQDVQERVVEEIREIVGDAEEITYGMCQDLKYMEAVINETLRMYPPLIGVSRTALNATTLKGFPVPAGTVIHACPYSIGRDPDSFENPDVFNPDRYMNSNAKNSKNNLSFMSFGFGPRQCIGMKLAMMEIKVALIHTLRDLVIEEATPDDLEVDDHTGVMTIKIPMELKLAHRQKKLQC